MDSIDMELAAILAGEPEIAIAGDLPAQGSGDTPILTGQQAQGDVLVIPLREAFAFPVHADQPKAHDQVIPLIEDGNGHQLRVDLTLGGCVRYVRHRQMPIDLGVLEVTGNAVVYVEQIGGGDPHGRLGIGPGLYRVRRQWEVTNPQTYWIGLIQSQIRRLRRTH